MKADRAMAALFHRINDFERVFRFGFERGPVAFFERAGLLLQTGDVSRGGFVRLVRQHMGFDPRPGCIDLLHSGRGGLHVFGVDIQRDLALEHIQPAQISRGGWFVGVIEIDNDQTQIVGCLHSVRAGFGAGSALEPDQRLVKRIHCGRRRAVCERLWFIAGPMGVDQRQRGIDLAPVACRRQIQNILGFELDLEHRVRHHAAD